ncbi:MAG TPA: PAS domain S-box protein, partial [Solirubrobacteraceae bacterium]|nr:PAS domain S-box protein [Solirubrobacteraceae bacterium]
MGLRPEPSETQRSMALAALRCLPGAGVALFDQDLRYVLVAGQAVDCEGFDGEELEGRRIADVLPPERWAIWEPIYRAALAGESATIEVEGPGGERWYRVEVSPWRDGELTGGLAVARDVTSARTAETALAQARKDIDRFFGLALDLMVIVSVDGRFIRVNPAVVETLGYTPEELTGRPFTDFIHPDDLESTLDTFATQAAGHPVASLENRYRCKDGSYRWLLWSATAVEDGMVFATAMDVTERRRMEDELRESRERALEASRLKSEFVANMSHEIRTPLNGVVSMAELLLGTRLTPEQAEYAQVALTSAEALMRVIGDILDFSKIEAGKLEIVSEDFSVRAAVEDVAEIVGTDALDRGL